MQSTMESAVLASRNERHAEGGIGGKPVPMLVVVWCILPVMLLYAGVTFVSTQQRAAGDMLTSTNTGGDLAFAIFFKLSALIQLVILLPYVRVLVSKLREYYVIALLCSWAFASCLWSQSPLDSLRGAIFLSLSLLFVLWLGVRFSVDQQMQLLMLTGTIAVALSLFVIVEFPARGLDTLHQGAWQGVFSSKNHMARIFLYLLTPGIHYPRKKGKVQLWRIAYILLMLLMIGMSNSKSAWILTLGYLSFALSLHFAYKWTRRDRAVIMSFFGPCFLGIALLALSKLDAILRLFNRDSTLNGRTAIWNVLKLSVAKRPLTGFGYQAFWAGTSSEGMNAFVGMYKAANIAASYAHSGYLSVTLETGVIGLGIILILVVWGVRSAWVCLEPNHGSYIDWYVGIIFLTVIYDIDEVIFMLPTYLPWLMFLIALIGLSMEAKRLTTEGRGLAIASGIQHNAIEFER